MRKEKTCLGERIIRKDSAEGWMGEGKNEREFMDAISKGDRKGGKV